MSEDGSGWLKERASDGRKERSRRKKKGTKWERGRERGERIGEKKQMSEDGSG